MTDSATLRRSAKYPREDKVATVKEIKELFTNSRASVFTEYRGLTVAQLKELRDRLRESDATYKVYKNTLVRIAAKEAGLSIDDTLVGPVAIAFANSDAVSAAKALNDFSVANKALILKGGVLGETVMSTDDIVALAKLPTREVLLAQSLLPIPAVRA